MPKDSSLQTNGIKERESLKQCCGGSWKLVMEFLMAREACYNQREKYQAFAGAEHSLVLTSSGVVYSFGINNSGQLGHGTLEDEYKPRLIRELQSIRIVQAALGIQKTMLVSDTGNVCAFGKELSPEYVLDPEPEEVEDVMTPKPMVSLKDIYVVQANADVSNGCSMDKYMNKCCWIQMDAGFK